MSTLSQQARSEAKSKVSRMLKPNSGDIDASGWTEPLGELGQVQTGPRPVSRSAFRRGGKVRGEHGAKRADRKPRASGGGLTATSFLNRNVKTANEAREGQKHVGGMRRGGRAHKLGGGPLTQVTGSPTLPPTTVLRKSGGAIPDGTRPAGGRMARKGGGRAKKGMNVNIIIAPPSAAKPPMMPLPGGPPAGPGGLHQAAPPMMPPAPAGAPPAMGPPPMMRKSGGRAYPITTGSGGANARKEKARAYGAAV